MVFKKLRKPDINEPFTMAPLQIIEPRCPKIGCPTPKNEGD
jgi:hypothetical protein